MSLRHHSLVVVMAWKLRWLGLRSLKEVSAGRVMIKDSPELCYTRPQQWTRFFKIPDQFVTLRNVTPPDVCGESLAPGRPVIVFTVAGSELKSTLCLHHPEQQNRTCDKECSDEGCWGPGPHMCTSCRHLHRGERCVALCNLLHG